VGSGPAGLTGAYHLARLGYQVTVFESGPELGGLLRTGIPGFRLPDEVVDRDINRILGLGIEIHTDHCINRQSLLEIARGHDATLVATGLQEQRELRLGLHGADAVMQGIEFLDRARLGQTSVDAEDVIVVGGGNTAIDAARTALRLGANSVRIVYRRSREEMPAIREEIDEAIEEGIVLELLSQPVDLRETGSGNGRNKETERAGYQLTCRRMQLSETDSSGRRTPVEIPGSEYLHECHRVILALGQSADVSVFPEGTEVREGNELLGLTETPVFAIGDFATQAGTVAAAIGSGRRAAVQVHNTLSGDSMVISERAEARRDVDDWCDEVIRSGDIKLHLFERHPSKSGATLPAGERRSTFAEIHAGLPDTGEATRCLSCGVCNECDLCVTYCPEGVLKRVGNEFVFDYSYCKGCGVCMAECPRSVILMSHL
jgi:NADPH-dependent glutamate synthase beta subunit-like oxidoreductase